VDEVVTELLIKVQRDLAVRISGELPPLRAEFLAD
jgi:hypothetical protein